jgi:hypothetical protein
MSEKTFICFDSRAGGGDTDDASVLEAWDGPDNDAKAIEEARECWSRQGAVVYKYDVKLKGFGFGTKDLTNQTYVGHVDDYRTFPKKKKK